MKIKVNIKVKNWNDSATEYYAFPIEKRGNQFFSVVFCANIDTPKNISRTGAWLVYSNENDKTDYVELEISQKSMRKAIVYILSI